MTQLLIRCSNDHEKLKLESILIVWRKQKFAIGKLLHRALAVGSPILLNYHRLLHGSTMANEERRQHNELQTRYFDERAELFEQKVPGDIQQRTAYIVTTAGVNAQSTILDVGSGTGVLIGHFLAAGAKQENIVACDLSQRMLALASIHYHKVHFWLGDVMEFSFDSVDSNFPPHVKAFDHIFFNACFGNMLDQVAVLRHSRTLLSQQGKIVISHPLPKFVQSLHATEPEIVPNLLPSAQWCGEKAKELGLTVEHFESSNQLYLAILAR